MKSRLLILLLIMAVHLHAQLKSSIGLDELPADSTAICDIPNYLGSFEESGLQQGDTIPHFALYDIEDQRYDIDSLFALGKPVVLVAGSYTCPVYRDRLKDVKDLIDEFKDDVHFLIIYGIEAHPDVDISPYFGRVNTGNRNITEGVLFRQATTYGERKATASTMAADLDVEIPVLLDGPCNSWWSTFGPAPNNAYLIDTNGIVIAKHGWFNRLPNDMACDIRMYLYDENCDDSNLDGHFTFELQGSSHVDGNAGEVLYVYGDMENPSDYDVEIEMRRLVEDLPFGWETSMCVDVCYPADQSAATIILPAGEAKLFTMYFYTNAVPGSGSVRMGFRNSQDRGNQFVQAMTASTEITTSIEVEENALLSVFPNPVNRGQQINVRSSATIQTIQWVSPMGHITDANTQIVLAPSGQSGMWTLRVLEDDLWRSTKVIVE